MGNESSSCQCIIAEPFKQFPIVVTSRKWPNLSKWFALVIGCLLMAFAGSSVVSFCAWQNAMRAILNQTESESSAVGSFGYIGYALAVPAGVIHDKFGSQVVTLIGGTLLLVAYSVLAAGTSPDLALRYQMAKYPFLVDVVYMMVGAGNAFAYMSALLASIGNFMKQHKGLVTGLVTSSNYVGAALLSLIYNLAFVNSGYTPADYADSHDLSNFFITSLMIVSTASVLGFLFVGRIKPSSGDEDEGEDNNEHQANGDEKKLLTKGSLIKISTSSVSEMKPLLVPSKAQQIEPVEPANDFADFPFEELPLSKAILRWNYVYLLLQYALAGGVQAVWLYNIATYLLSFGMASSDVFITDLSMIAMSVTGAISGFVSDKIVERTKYPRAIVLLVPYCLQTLAMFISIFYGDQFAVIILTTLAIGIGTGVTTSQTPVIISELYGSENLGTNFAISLLSLCLFEFGLTMAFSQIYEAAIIQPGAMTCVGLKCFTWSFALFAGISLASVIVVLGLMRNMTDNAEYRRQLRQTLRSASTAAGSEQASVTTTTPAQMNKQEEDDKTTTVEKYSN